MDRILIEQLRLSAIIGVYPWERRIRQPLLADIELHADVAGAALDDAIDAALNYASVADCLRTVVEASRFQLLESLAEHAARVLLDSFSSDGLRLTLTKPHAIGRARGAAVAIERRRAETLRRVWLSLGSNIERESSLRAALRALRERFGGLLVSSVYHSEAVGFDGEPFYNLVVGVDTDVSLAELAGWARQLEAANGRVRSGNKFDARTLDVDVLTWGYAVGDFDGITMPRDEILRYAFVLGPLAEVAPRERHPLTGETYAALWAGFDQASQPMRRIDFDPLA